MISAFFGFEAVSLICAGIIGHSRPDLRASANEFIWHLSPSLKLSDFTQFGIFLAPLMGLYYAFIGLGIWFMNRWVRAWVIVSFLYWFADAGVSLVLARQTLSSVNSIPFALEFVANVLTFGYLFAPEVMRIFGIPDSESDDWWEMFRMPF